MTKIESEDSLSKLVNKAKKKLNKQTDADVKIDERVRFDNYEFKKSSRKEEFKKLEKKIKEMRKNEPDCIDPIGQLIDHKVYDNLSDSGKQSYIQRLSKNYIEICNKI